LWRPLLVASRLATALAVVGAWWRRCRGRLAGVEPGAPTLERPWRRTWDHLPKRSAGADFTRADYAAARARAREVARATLGDALWAQLQRQGYLDVPSTLQPGLTYRLRTGGALALAGVVPLYQPHVPPARGGVLRPAIPAHSLTTSSFDANGSV